MRNVSDQPRAQSPASGPGYKASAAEAASDGGCALDSAGMTARPLLN